MRADEMLVTPQEAKQLFEKSYVGMIQYQWAHDLLGLSGITPPRGGHSTFDFCDLLLVAYHAGKVNQVREERARKRGRAEESRG